MQVDDQRITKKDAVFDNVKILNGNQIPLTNTLTGKLPLRGSLIALKSGNIHDLYYGDGLQWVPVTNGGSAGEQPLNEVLAVGNFTGGNDIVISTNDRITSENDGEVLIRGAGNNGAITLDAGAQVSIASLLSTADDAVRIDGNNGGATILARKITLSGVRDTPDAVRIEAINSAGGIDIDAGSGTGGITIDAGSGGISSNTSGQLSLTSSSATADAVRINASNAGGGGIDIDAGDGGIAADTSGQLALTSSEPATDAVLIQGSNVSGGVRVESGSGGTFVTSSGAITITTSTSTSVGIALVTTNIDSDVDIVAARSVNVSANGETIDLDASAGLGEVRLISGTELNINGFNNFISHPGGSAVQDANDRLALVINNVRVGSVTMASNDAIQASESNLFRVNNSNVAVGDLIFLTSAFPTNPNVIFSANAGTGFFEIAFTNPTSSAVLGTPVINFMVIKT